MKPAPCEPVVYACDPPTARQALLDSRVGGVLHEMPLASRPLCRELENHRIVARCALGPYHFKSNGKADLIDTLAADFERISFAVGNQEAREAFAHEALRALRFFSETLLSTGFSYRFRFIPREAQASRPHYDASALTLVRTLRGPGTWIHRSRGPRFQVGIYTLLILKGTAFPNCRQKQALLHDYPDATAPRSSMAGRIVMIARAGRWRAST